MRHKARLSVGILFLVLCCGLAQAAQVPISVYPNPIDFGTVPINSASYPLNVFVSNVTATTVVVTSITLSGANVGDFNLVTPTCAVSISGGQSCQMQLQFTPGAVGNRSATMVVSFTGTGSPISIPLVGAGGNPIPNITSVNPPTAYPGGPAFTMTLNGTGFLPASVVSFNNSPRATTYVSSTKLTASILASDISTSQFVQIYVTNPAPGGGTAGWSDFQIISPNPNLSTASPNSLVAGSGASSIRVNGANFAGGATVLWNGKARPTTFLSSNQLSVQLTAADVGKAQIGHLAVSNPARGGVSSGPGL